ncbi:Hypothetical predicted protein [Paramuricea clavata]|uniref:Uncharacterized protein n=1 Tax=Paramuricea clavata TaxID=317549 RepID=A0A7D9LNF8_PARCT|nr:Hypothetical predicted protein [Paramuricea clavata]
MKLTSHELTNVQSIQLTQILSFCLAEGIHNSSVDESSVAGLESSLPFEKDDKMKELPTIKYDQKNVCITVSWDSSVHDSPYLNRATSNSERVYLIIKARVSLSSPLAMDLILRKRICVRIYKRQSLKDSLMRKLWKDTKTRCCVTYELVSHIPRQPGEETEERGNLAERAAAAVSKNDEEHEVVLEKYHRGISHVEGLLKLDKLRQEVVVKEKLAASGKPLRKFASTPNLLQGSFDLSSIGSKNDSLDIDFGQGSMRKGSPAQIRHVAVSFDDWDNPRTQDTNLLTPTVIVSSTPTNTLETVLEHSAPSSPQPVIMVTETSFPYIPEKTSPRVARSLETEFNEERQARDEKEPLINISSEEDKVLNDSLGNIPISNKLVEIPIEFENWNEENTDFSPSKLEQNNAKLENDLTTKLDLLEFDSSNDARPNLVHDSGSQTISDVATIGNIHPAVGDWSGTLDNGSLLSNSVDSGLHESTDQLLDARDTMDTDGSSGQNSTKRDYEGELRIGQVISVGDSKVGSIRYIGTTEFASGEWVGVELELPVGRNDGSVNGKRYFTCKPRYGTFVRADKVTLPKTRPKSTSSSRVIETSRRVSSGTPGTSSPRNNSGVQTRSKPRGGSSSDTAKRKELNRRSNILF